MPIFKTKPENFWKWFADHEAELFEFDSSDVRTRERLFDSVAAALRRVDRDLAFEFGPTSPRREFVISAGGIKRAFPAVIALTKCAPKHERWQITAFRPRRWPLGEIEFRGKQARPEEVTFTLLQDGSKAGIYLFIPSFSEDDMNWKQIGYLLSDEAIGEYDVEMRLGLVKMLSPDQRTEGVRHPLVQLPTLFDEFVTRLEGRSGTPS